MNYKLFAFLDIVLLINSFIIVVVIILERRKPEKTLVWMLIFAVFPLVGIVFYIFFGRTWIKRKPPKSFSTYTKEKMSRFIKEAGDEEIVPLIKLLARNSYSPLFLYNEIVIFKDGNEKFAALKKEIENARHHIHLEYFIVNGDTIGNEIKDLLIKKAQQGVKVRFIIDRIGSIKTRKAFYTQMQEAGIDVVSYPYVLARFLNRLNIQINYRNHRKVAVIDGKVGFIGGINIGDEYMGKSKMGYWRDTHLMVKGDFVFGLQAVFFDDFLTIKRAHARSMHFSSALKRYYPMDTMKKGSMMQFAISGPDSEHPAVMQAILKMISMAEKTIFISTPYFIPNESILDALKSAAISGVDVRILFPGKYDHYIVYKASMTYLRELSKYGAKIYLYDKKAFLHSKVVSIDGRIASVGSANMDVRSFFINFELNSIIYDEKVVSKLDAMFFDDLHVSTCITRQYFDKLPATEKFIQAVARMFSSLL